MAALNPSPIPSMRPLHTHATHHRSQITAALTAPGQSAPELDWVHHLPPKTAEAQPI